MIKSLKLGYGLFFFLLIGLTVNAQVSTPTTIKRIGTFNPKAYQPGFDAHIDNLEAPNPAGAKAGYLQQKIKASEAYPKRLTPQAAQKTNNTTPEISIARQFDFYGPYLDIIDTAFPMGGGNPLDNSMAVSNDGLLLAGVNSKFYAHDLVADTFMFRPTLTDNTISFTAFANAAGITTDFPFDPKITYDPVNDRFILVFLSGRNPNNSENIVAFSSTNNPTDEWYIYEVSGNPRPAPNDTVWTDYPAISFTETELFLTVNMIIPNVSWQVGFDGSIIWQIDLQDGYAGADELTAVFHDDIKYDGRYIRNLCPVKGANGHAGPNAYFLSNRNFDLENDSIFVVEVTNTIASGESEVRIDVGTLPVAYGFPPNGIQEDTDTSDPTEGLQTNDARWLGAILLNDAIQFTGNTMNHANGRAAVYHGFIDNISNEGGREFSGTIISDDNMDYGYPNIAWTGADSCDFQAIVAFDHTAADVYCGISAVFVQGDRSISPVTRIREGEGYVAQMNGGYERWGDYFGIQRKYNEPGTVWTTGFFGKANNRSSIHAAQLVSPDTALPVLSVMADVPTDGSCEGEISYSGSNALAPYFFLFNDEESCDTTRSFDFCDGTYTIELIDARNCRVSKSGEFELPIPQSMVFPNPFSGNELTLDFNAENDGDVRVELVNMSGQIADVPLEQLVKEGRNRLNINLAPLAEGVYILRMSMDGESFYEEKLVKVD